MKLVMVMFDSLNRNFLPGYGGNPEHYPNFSRLARHTARFENSYVCSMPCMPARRDLHTGRPNFLHTPWAPLQPFDSSMPALLQDSGTSSHLITDHYHYLEDGGATYHNRYSTWQVMRGQEGDPWIGQTQDPVIPANINGKGRRQDWINRGFLNSESDWPQVQTFNAGVDFIERNHADDNWFLQIETFDPHEPFTAPPEQIARFTQAGGEPVFDWPTYGGVTESPEEIRRIRDNYAALVGLCDQQLGRVLDLMDRHRLWQDTMLIVWTDHGFLLGEHGLWAKNHDVIWNEIGKTPFYCWDPRSPECAGKTRKSLVQPAIDLAPTLLSFFGCEKVPGMTGHDLFPCVADDAPQREAAIYGYFNQPLHVTDGQRTLVQFPQKPGHVIHEYNMMPTRMRGFMSASDQTGMEVVPPLPFTQDKQVIRYPRQYNPEAKAGTQLLYDNSEPGWSKPVDDPSATQVLLTQARQLCIEAHAPAELLEHFGLDSNLASFHAALS